MAVPVSTRASVTELSGVADDVICLQTPSSLSIVGGWYSQFGRTSDDEVLELLHRAGRRWPSELIRQFSHPLALSLWVAAGHSRLTRLWCWLRR